MVNETQRTTDTEQVRLVINAVIAEQGRRVTVLAKRLGVNTFTLHAVLAGRRTLTDDLARRLASELGIPAAVIDHLSEPPQAA